MTAAATSPQPLGPVTEPLAVPLELPERPRNIWRDAWDRLRRRPANYVYAAIVVIYVLIGLTAFFPPLGERWWVAENKRPIPLYEQTVGESYQRPSLRAGPSLWLGADIGGRSVLWRLLYGTRIALTVATLASILTIVLGTVLGIVAGYFGGWIDSAIIWLFSTVSSVPDILLMTALAYAVKERSFSFHGEEYKLTGIPTIVIALGLTSWVGLCRLMRGEVLKHRDRDYVAAARAVGVGTPRILFRHILPNVFHYIIITFTLGIVGFIQYEVVLSFLGLGITDRPSWGRMIDDAKLELMRGVWWQLAAATVAIFLLSLALGILGDELRDALDPRLRGVD